MKKFVVHCNFQSYDEYIGREMPAFHLQESIWHNPRNVWKQCKEQQTLKPYVEYLISRPDLVYQVSSLRDKILGCWCAPSRCHGDILHALSEIRRKDINNLGLIDIPNLTAEEDGVSHLNIYSKGKTELGRWLSKFAHSPFTCEDGKFNSIEGYWYWLLKRNSQLRELSGYEAKTFGESLPNRSSISQDKFEEKIKKALFHKILSQPNYSRMLRKNNLPLTHYYFYSRVVDAGYEWVVREIEYIRLLLRELARQYAIG